MKEIPADNSAQIIKLLTKAIITYETCQKACEKALKTAPSETLEINHTHSGNQYYVREQGKRKYLSHKEQSKIHELANKEYYTKLQKVMIPQLALIKKLLRSLTRATPTTVYSHMHPTKQALVKPFFQTDEEYAKAWQEAPYPHGEPPTGRYQTERGETVRSKSEILIANALYTAGIPYRYEEEVDIPGYGSVRPDFTVLNPRTRHQFYWEHFGMMDDFGYREKTALKTEGYYRAGILPNHLLATFETQERPISITEIKQIIRDYLQ